MDSRKVFSRCGKLSLRYPRYIFYHALSFFAALSGPPCHYRYIYIYSGKRRPDAERYSRVPFRESSEGESPRGGGG